MPLIKAQCPNCGGALEVDNTQDAAICPFCKTPYIVEKAINQYNMNAAAVNFNGTVNMIAPDQKNRMFENAESQLKIGEFARAYSSFSELSEKYAGDPRVWDGLLNATTHNKTKKEFDINDYYFVKRCYTNLQRLDETTSSQWNNTVVTYEKAYQQYKAGKINKVDELQAEYDSFSAKYKTNKFLQLICLAAIIAGIVLPLSLAFDAVAVIISFVIIISALICTAHCVKQKGKLQAKEYEVATALELAKSEIPHE